MKTNEFLALLEQEAAKQSSLEKNSFLPKRFSFLASFFVTHLWQLTLILAAILAAIKVNYL